MQVACGPGRVGRRTGPTPGRRALPAGALLGALAGLSGCASGPGGRSPEAGPPPLAVSFPAGRELRFRRVTDSRARSEGLTTHEGDFDGFDVRGSVEFLVRTRGVDGAGRAACEVRIGELALDWAGLQGHGSFDTRRPETLEALGKDAEGRRALASLGAVRTTPKSWVVSPDGSAVEEEAGAGGGRAHARGGLFDALPSTLGWFPGSLPFGRLEGPAAEGESWRSAGALPVQMAGIHFDDHIPVEGRWRVAGWDPATRTARLAMEGGPASPGQALRSTRVESCTVEGEATWDARVGLVTRSSTTAHVVLRGSEALGIRIDWTFHQEESLVR